MEERGEGEDERSGKERGEETDSARSSHEFIQRNLIILRLAHIW
jgi:hypothetical protein